jgi:hypothetical protein
MTVTVQELISLSETIARDVDARLEVAGITPVDGDAAGAELLVTIQGCHREPCSLVLNLNRRDVGAVEHELRKKLTAALTAHLTE